MKTQDDSEKVGCSTGFKSFMA